MSNLLDELRRSPDGDDARVADLLASLRPAAPQSPRASAPLAAFLAAVQSPGRDAAPRPLTAPQDDDLVVQLGPPPRGAARRRRLVPVLLAGGVWGKTALATAAVAAAVVTVATAGPGRDVVVRPADRPSTPASAPATAQDDRTRDAEPVPHATHAATEHTPGTARSPRAHAPEQPVTTLPGAGTPAGATTPGRGDAQGDDGADDRTADQPAETDDPGGSGGSGVDADDEGPGGGDPTTDDGSPDGGGPDDGSGVSGGTGGSDDGISGDGGS
jgi:hypothetical protein